MLLWRWTEEVAEFVGGLIVVGIVFWLVLIGGAFLINWLSGDHSGVCHIPATVVYTVDGEVDYEWPAKTVKESRSACAGIGRYIED